MPRMIQDLAADRMAAESHRPDGLADAIRHNIIEIWSSPESAAAVCRRYAPVGRRRRCAYDGSGNRPSHASIDDNVLVMEQTQSRPPAPRLYLVTPVIVEPSAIAASLDAAMQTADIAAVLLRLAEAGERELVNRIRALGPAVQDRGVALLIDGYPDLVARAGADGAHLTGIEALEETISALKPDRIAGAGGLRSRDDAMVAGEKGADYVMFGEPDRIGRRPDFAAIEERVGWWAELFQPPCVGYAASLDEVVPLAQAGADFVALGDWVWTDAHGTAAAIAAAAGRLAEPVA
jgi:thiamine-phosphate pyrophosphorylase